MPKKRTKPSRGRSAGPSHASTPNNTPAAVHVGGDIATNFMAGKALQIARRLVKQAWRGNMKAQRLCIERLVPMSRERPLPLQIPAPQDAQQITVALEAVFAGLGTGQITPSEAEKLAAILEYRRNAIETHDLEARLLALETPPPPPPPPKRDDLPDDLGQCRRDIEKKDPETDDQ